MVPSVLLPIAVLLPTTVERSERTTTPRSEISGAEC
jgi:hypothetical protein